jgi:molecular chaperone DnaJ
MNGGAASRILPLPAMPVKDYYKILEVKPGASLAEIKKSFRRLALRHHPDTNQGNKYSEAWFRELQEAYDVLTDPAKKDAYHQERWLQQTMGRSMENPKPLTPQTILLEAHEMLRTVSDLDHFRMDHRALANNLADVLNDDKLAALAAFAEPDTNRKIAEALMKAAAPLHYKHLAVLFKRLKSLCANDAEMMGQIKLAEKNRRRAFWWTRNQWWVFLLATALLCGAIYWLTPR